MQLLDESHYDAKLSAHEVDMIRYWVESAAPYPGTYASLGSGTSRGRVDQQVLARRCGFCHSGRTTLHHGAGLKGFSQGHQLIKDDPMLPFCREMTINLSRPENSMLLLAPLATSAGGYGICRPLSEQELESWQKGAKLTSKAVEHEKPILPDRHDPDYQALLGEIEKIKKGFEKFTRRFDIPGFRPNEHYIREMKNYGILPKEFSDETPIDVYETDEKYWRSHWYMPLEGE